MVFEDILIWGWKGFELWVGFEKIGVELEEIG